MLLVEEKNLLQKFGVKKGSGKIYVNGIEMNKYFKRPVHQIIVTRPLEVSKVLNSYDVKCSVKGGGLSGQAGQLFTVYLGHLFHTMKVLKKDLKRKTHHKRL